MEVLHWLKALPWIVSVRESAWQYPVIETLHGIGMGLLVGTLTVMSLRLIGGLRRMPFSTLRGLAPLVWTGLAINACTGVVMFMTDGPRLVTNWIFGAKMLLIAVGLGVAVTLQRRIAGAEPRWSAGEAVARNTRMLSVACLLVWYGAIVAGRVTAFLGDQ